MTRRTGSVSRALYAIIKDKGNTNSLLADVVVLSMSGEI